MARGLKFSLTEAIGRLFTPRKRGTPTPSLGTRKSKLSFVPGRNRARVKGYNKLSAENQWIIDATGNREKYLRGEVKLTEARSQLREIGVSQGVVKPTRRKATNPVTQKLRNASDADVRRVVQTEVIPSSYDSPNIARIEQTIAVATQQTKNDFVFMPRQARMQRMRANGKRISDLRKAGKEWTDIIEDDDLSQLTIGMYH